MKKLIFTILTYFTLSFCINAQTVYNFNDGQWGNPVTERPASGSYTSTTINKVKFNNAMLYQKDGKGQMRVLVDKSSLKGSIEFPEFSSGMKEVIIEGSVGTEDKTLVLEEKRKGRWKTVGEQTLTKNKENYTMKISEDATQIRILNGTNSSLTIYKVIIQ